MEALDNYIPEQARAQIHSYLNAGDFTVKITKQRATKHGDFRRLKNGTYQITINENLNPHQFLLTLVHEIAHYKTYKLYGRVQPHGTAWKNTFRELMLPFVRPAIYPNTILPHLAQYLRNPKASTDSDPKLSLALKQDDLDSDKNYIFELSFGSEFYLKNRKFTLLEKKRTRFLCLEIATQKKYLINQNTEVSVLS